jgi:hypothetical protein
MKVPQVNDGLEFVKHSLVLSFGWAIFHSYIQFTVLVTEGNRIMPIWFLVELIVSIFASSQLSKLEHSLKTWIASVLFSIFITLGLIVSPVLLGALDSRFMGLVVMGAVQPIVTILLLSTPLDLLGCFLGQVMRNRLL